MSNKKLVSVTYYTEDILKALEQYDYELVCKLRGKIKEGCITIKKEDYKIILKFEEEEAL
jgi:hypothetical protein